MHPSPSLYFPTAFIPAFLSTAGMWLLRRLGPCLMDWLYPQHLQPCQRPRAQKWAAADPRAALAPHQGAWVCYLQPGETTPRPRP